MRRDTAMFLAAVFVIAGVVFAAVIIFVPSGGGGGSSVCDQPLPALGSSGMSQLAFQNEDAGLSKVIEAASSGDADAAEKAFLYDNEGEVHNFTHNVDPPLRRVDEKLAKELCKSVTQIEEEFLVDRRADRIALQAMRVRELIRDAAEALGYARPGG
jgi:hypothetical protein